MHLLLDGNGSYFCGGVGFPMISFVDSLYVYFVGGFVVILGCYCLHCFGLLC